jgi:hypothetical protein
VKPRLLVIGPLPRRDSPVGGTQVSFQGLVERLHGSGTFEVEVLDTSRRAADRSARSRALDDSLRLATILGQLARRARRCDAVVFNASSGGTVLAGPLIALACGLARKPLAMRVFGGDLDLKLARANGVRRRLVLATALRAQLVLLQTQALCRQLGGPRTHWLPTTRDLPELRSERPARCRRFLFLSQLRPEKGFADAIAAIERAPRGCTLTVAGPPMSRTDTRLLARSERVDYVGAIDSADVPRVLAAHDALVFPSRHDGEGMPGVVIEALQSNLPVIATRWRALPELVEDGRNGLLVAPGDIGGLAAAIAGLANDPQLYARLAEGARETGERFRAGPWHAQLEAWLLELCGVPPARTEAAPAPDTADDGACLGTRS